MVAQQYQPDILCITKSWLTSNIPNTAVSLGGYHIIRKDIIVISYLHYITII